MEQTNFPISRDLSLKQLTADALVEIERLGYSRRSRNRYRAIWEHLIEFSDLNELADDFSGDLAMRFLEEYRVGDEKKETPGQSWRKHLVWGVSVLADFAVTGRIERGFADVEAIHLIPDMQNTLRDYLQYCKDRLQLRPGTLHGRTTELTIFLDFLHSRKEPTLDQIQASDLSEFISCRADIPLGKIRRDHWLEPKTVARIVSDVRSFLRFLTMRGILQKDLGAELPKIRVPRDAKIPSVWEQELVVRLLEAVDRSSAKGKRDYAILLLACRLGMRVGDIRTLKIEQLHWEDSIIEVTQSKTPHH